MGETATELLLIDGNSLINRAFYATPVLTNDKGQYTNAVYGFVNMLLKGLEDIRPRYLMVAFDMRAKTFRHLMYDGYKAKRKGMPDELAAQMPLLHELLAQMKVTVVEQEGVEADDLLGSAAKKFKVGTAILTGDRDCLQLIDDTTVVFLTRKGLTDLEEVDETALKEHYRLTPAGVVEYKALRGDASDNIPGVPGIGEKTALSLLEQYGTLDNLYAHLAEIPGKLREKLESGREMAYLSRTLAAIRTDCPIPAELSDLTFEFPFGAEVRKAFQELGFRSLLKREAIFAGPPPAEPAFRPEVVPVADAAALKAEVEACAGDFAYCEDKDLHFAGEEGREVRVVITDTFLGDGLTAEAAQSGVRPLLRSGRLKWAFDAKALFTELAPQGVEWQGQPEDLALKYHLCRDSADPKNLANCLEKEGLSAEAPAAGLIALSRKLDGELAQDPDLEKLYREIELPLSKVLFDMERTGFKVDEAVLDELGARYRAEMEEASEAVFEMAGERFNLNSPRQLQTVLFEKLGLRGGKKTKTGLSTGADVLESLQDEHPVIPLILQYRKVAKLVSTYVDGLKAVIDPRDGRIHTVFKQTLTSTGRLSSAEPNLQNIPVRESEGRELRKAFVKKDDLHILVSADYSQIELRLLAHFSEDPVLTRAFAEGEDIHADTAARVFGVPPELVTPEMRRSAKAVNFGIIYGISDFGLSRQLGIPVKRAKEFIGRYFETYPSVKAYMEECVRLARERGYARSLFGRRRRIPELFSNNYNTRAFGERAAMNMPLQGSAADLIKLAMVRVAERFRQEGMDSRMILQVHDELIVEAPLAECERVKQILSECMTEVRLRVPLAVQMASGENWYEAK